MSNPSSAALTWEQMLLAVQSLGITIYLRRPPGGWELTAERLARYCAGDKHAETANTFAGANPEIAVRALWKWVTAPGYYVCARLNSPSELRVCWNGFMWQPLLADETTLPPIYSLDV